MVWLGGVRRDGSRPLGLPWPGRPPPCPFLSQFIPPCPYPLPCPLAPGFSHSARPPHFFSHNTSLKQGLNLKHYASWLAGSIVGSVADQPGHVDTRNTEMEALNAPSSRVVPRTLPAAWYDPKVCVALSCVPWAISSSALCCRHSHRRETH